MRGAPHFNWNWFRSAAKVLRAKGHEVVSPAEIDEEMGYVFVEYDTDGTISDVRLTSLYDFDTAMSRDLAEVADCDGIVLGPDWLTSQGARWERRTALANGLAVFYGVESVPNVKPPEVPNWWATMETVPDVAGRDLYPILDRVDLLRHQQRTSTEQTPYVRGEFPDPLPEEVRVVDPETGGAKGSKLARFDLLPPDAMWAVAEHFGLGARKYEDRNWEKGYAWSLSYAALQRHLTEFWAGEDIDDETSGFHLAAAAVHCLFLLAFQMRGAGTDDRSKTLPRKAG